MIFATVLPWRVMRTVSPFSTRVKISDARFRNSVNDKLFITVFSIVGDLVYITAHSCAMDESSLRNPGSELGRGWGATPAGHRGWGLGRVSNKISGSSSMSQSDYNGEWEEYRTLHNGRVRFGAIKQLAHARIRSADEKRSFDDLLFAFISLGSYDRIDH
jgi:hypothetical protein